MGEISDYYDCKEHVNFIQDFLKKEIEKSSEMEKLALSYVQATADDLDEQLSQLYRARRIDEHSNLAR